MGEEIDFDKSQSSDSFSIKSSFFHQTAKLHGSHQESSDTSNSTVRVNPFVSRTDYDKLCLSLLCGLPNEQELALNVCTILSNEGNYMLHLEQAPKLVDLLVAQTGIFPQDDESLKMLYLESWKDLKGRNMHRFWRSTLDLENSELMELLGLDIGDYDPHCKLLNLEGELGAHNVEGQRVVRIALILHNLSFEKYNVPVLISSRNFMRFMLVCIHSSWGNLKQIAYDTLSNLAFSIKLSVEKDVCSRFIFRTVVNGILSFDRYMNIRSMDILAQLCSYDSNEDVIPSRLDVEVYQQMVAFLTVRDIMLLFYTLEALYALSDLGRYACDKIVSVHRCIGALVSLLTLEPTEYGPSGQINMKVVKTLVPADADAEKDCSDIELSIFFFLVSSGLAAPVDDEKIDCGSHTVTCVCGIGETKKYVPMALKISAVEDLATGKVKCEGHQDPYQACANISCLLASNGSSSSIKSSDHKGILSYFWPHEFTIPAGGFPEGHRFTRETEQCNVPTLKNAKIKCWKWPNWLNCDIICIPGYALDAKGTSVTTKNVNCRNSENIWKPIDFKDCKPYLNCNVKLVKPGDLKCMEPIDTPAYCDISCLDYDAFEATSLQKYECLDENFARNLPHCAVLMKEVLLIPKPR